jgi:septum formation topological specificity factor MinE
LIGRHAGIDANKVQFMVVRGSTASTLTVDIEVPFRVAAAPNAFALPASAGG